MLKILSYPGTTDFKNNGEIIWCTKKFFCQIYILRFFICSKIKETGRDLSGRKITYES